MLNVKSVIGVCIFALILTEVTSWTIDLPEVRKFFFERNERKRGDENKIYFDRRPELVNFNNIEGDSPHNSPHLYEERYANNDKYADKYGYHTYMEKKVKGIFHNGGIYLEGLRRAMEQFSEQLENCSRLERSRPPTNRTWVPETERGTPQPLSSEELAQMRCENVTRESETVRRLSAMVVWAIRELQDIAYARDYDKDSKNSEEDILLQLAWALDELARLTGYEPDTSRFATHATPAPEPTTTPFTFFNLPIPNDGPTISNCIKMGDTTVPATVRCAVPIPEAVLQFLNMSNYFNGSTIPAIRTLSPGMGEAMMQLLGQFRNSSTGQGQQTFNNMSPDEIRQQWLTCFSATPPDPNMCLGFISFMQFLNNNNFGQQPLNPNFQLRPNRETDSQLEILEAAEDSVIPLQKRSLTRSRTKRSINDPLNEFLKYYGKYKAWSNSNPDLEGNTDTKTENFDVKNDLTHVKSVQKRSIEYSNRIMKFSKYASNNLSSKNDLKYFKLKSGFNYNKVPVQADRIKAYIDKLLHGNGVIAKTHVRKLDKLIKSVHKRSVHYSKLHRPRVPEDPMQDISYYVKHKPGTNKRPNPAHAAQVRLGLQEIFERGNIIVVRRYGSNYIPGVAPLAMGGAETTSDI